ncbi:glycosyltransferase family 2 protein [Achromobacter aloeverae]|uniref:Glycosyl transferase family 2 n=1 Tax=Achromobacter aloeverae TaxID=1750518 RepID=A0A4Q1HGN0_9BURK|nr:glycosyltransferase family 2 protein [Achromobacter aloeverae]RXN86630.1 glycosyl transferase family 2 [Achromobacter aloeverae]
MTLLLNLVFLLLALPVTLACVYLGVLTLLSARPAPMPPSTRRLRFDVLVPAHNETAVITRTVGSLLALDWPADRFRVIVIADNCDDDTAALARAAGARVIERANADLRGKGYALEYGVEESGRDGYGDAVVVIDADSVVSPNLLEACATRLEQGAEAVQVHYGVLNPDDSWRTRMIAIAYAAFHAVRSRARERLRVSCGLRGNGMCLSRALLQRHPMRVFSMAEDLEYGIQLGLGGVRVWYADEAAANAEFLSSEQGSRSQRQRWEGGRFAVVRAYAGRLLMQGLRRRDRVSFELGLDLLLFPLGYVGLQIGVLLLLSAVAAIWLPAMLGWTWLALALLLILVLHTLRGWQLTSLGPRALLDLARVPFFIAWKLFVLLRYKRNKAWVKTTREDN